MLGLRDELFWCRCADGIVLLDLRADRYFCLGKDAQASFVQIAQGNAGDGNAGDADAAAVAGLLRSGLVVEGGDEGRTWSPPSPPTGELFENCSRRAPLHAICYALLLEATARWGLRRRPLAQLVRNLPAAEAARGEGSEGGAAPIVAAFAGVGLVLAEKDRCLPRALAVCRACRRRGIPARLLFGVRMGPFAAHAWVQLDDKVVVGDFEQVRLFTPIAAFP